ncbi:MAG: hypothetical protein JNM75_02420 [Rhodospirillales bacterium]|nr:hypothetical protein [Rhodospirillales bacterium]
MLLKGGSLLRSDRGRSIRGVLEINKEEARSIMIPDTLEGALILSAIDFFLSFIIIGGIGIVLAAFPHLNQLGEVSDQDLKSGH